MPRQAQPLPAVPGPQAQWYGPGRLYRAPFLLAGKAAYGLEPANGQLRMYLTAGGWSHFTSRFHRVFGLAPTDACRVITRRRVDALRELLAKERTA